MRWLRLYLRSRRIPRALVIATAATAAVWALALAYTDSRTINTRALSLTVMIVVAAFAPTLSGADDALDHTGAINWPVRRAGHALLTWAGIAGLLLLTAATDTRFAPVEVVLRDTAGLLGLAAAGAALFGAAWAWVAPLTWTLVAVTPFVDASADRRMQLIGWLIQPAGTTAATICAVLLAVGGLAAYTLRGCPLRPAAETAPDA